VTTRSGIGVPDKTTGRFYGALSLYHEKANQKANRSLA
jgi:hypothetical protein